MGIRETKKDNSELFKWDGKPSAGQVFPLAAQHVLAAVVGCVTPAILVANAANNAGGNVDMGLLIQMSLVFAALSTPVSYTHLRAHETGRNLVCRLLLEKKKIHENKNSQYHESR